MLTYEVKKGFFLAGDWIAPAAAGEPARTILLPERVARYHVLAGSLVPAPATE